jgi:arylsulfatase A-like enzyme
VPSLPSLLAREGYATAAFDAIPFLKEMTGARAFASHFDAATYGSWVPDAALLEGVADWMRRPGPPRLAFVRLHGPHWPYVADPEHLAAAGEARFAGLDHRFNQGGYGLADEATPGDGFRLQDPEEYRRRFFDLRYSPRELAHMRVHYDAAVRTADARVGRLLASLREARLLDRTLVVVTSDHGESFGEHGYLQHGPRVDEPVLRVPLIVRFPAQAPHGRPGQRVAGLVRSVDVLPTVLDTLGLEAPKRLDGVSLLPAIDRAADLRLSCYAESDREFIGIDPELALPGVAGKQRALRDARFKILYRHDGRGPVYRLFDLERDPGETGDVSADHPRELERLRTELDALMRGDVSPHDREAMLTAEQTERLRALGYLR